ncbi:MAG: alanine--tRNA ligase, partial [Candidatus Thiodiazotropha sp. (ex Lucinoma borealis)]|nr:alanine--tRNA ligase [Candidatus Thiodiazotropha sp. (ex Lucinoma borealis)]
MDIGMRMLNTEISTKTYALSWLESQNDDWRLIGINVSGYGGMNYQFDGLIEHQGDEIAVEIIDGNSNNQSELDSIYQAIYAFKNGTFGGYKKLILVVYWKDDKASLHKQIQNLIDTSGFPLDDVFHVTEGELKVYRRLPGRIAFKLHDTYGFPLDLTQDVCREHDVVVDVPGFEIEMAAQRERGRAANPFGPSESIDLDLEEKTLFSGYDHLEDQADIVAILRDGESVETLHQGESGMIFLDHTPFYAESGGQVGDMGTLEGKGVFFEVEDTRKQSGELFAHIGKSEEGNLSVGETVTAQVNAYTRQATALNHSATHLLHAALRQVLGDHVAQKGSLVDAERLRFDFSHFEPITREQLQTIEQ